MFQHLVGETRGGRVVWPLGVPRVKSVPWSLGKEQEWWKFGRQTRAEWEHAFGFWFFCFTFCFYSLHKTQRQWPEAGSEKRDKCWRVGESPTLFRRHGSKVARHWWIWYALFDHQSLPLRRHFPIKKTRIRQNWKFTAHKQNLGEGPILRSLNGK